MLGDGDSGGGAEDGGGGGNVDGAEAVAAGADDIEDFAGACFGVERRGNGFVAERAGERGDFGWRFAFLREGGQEAGLEIRRNGFIGEPVNGLPDLFIVERTGGGELLDEFFEHAMILGLNASGSNRKCVDKF